MHAKTVSLLSGWLVLGGVVGCATTPKVTGLKADFFVATNGNDAWSGTLPAPDAKGTDGPFATLHQAQVAVRRHMAEMKARRSATAPATQGATSASKPTTGCTILIRGGTYRLAETITFTPEDSGGPDGAVTYAAYPGERPVFSGGKVITGWKRNAGSVWTARVPEVEAGTLYFNQLFVNGQRRTRARTPNTGYLRTDGPMPHLKNYRDRKNPEVKMGFRYKDGDIRRWDRLEDVNLLVYHSWTASLNWIKSIDEANRVVRFTAPSNWPIGYWERTQRYYVENALELLDAPGEWYLNRKTGVVSYWPLPGEDMTKADVVAPTLRKLVVFAGDPKAGKLVKHIKLKELTFEHADWFVKDRGRADGQAAAWLEAAVFARGAHHCELVDCEVRHVGEYGVYFEQGCKDNRVFRCHVHDVGAGGVRLGYTSGEKDEDLVALRNVVDNCFIHDGGHVFRAGIGAWIGRSSHNRLTHNEICDFDYTGISVGWSWGYAASSANHNVIEFNHVHHIGNGVLSDMGGIYSLGKSPGTVVRNNIFHDIYSYAYGGWGLYTDEGSSEIVMENNVVYNTKTGGFHQHYGKENVVRNNILAFSQQGQVQRSREEEHVSFTFERNIVYFDNGNLLSSRWKNGNWRMDYNCYWDTSDPEITFAGSTFAEWQAKGFDQHSIIADPLFVDAEKRDFRLKPDSLAVRKLGFKPIDMSKVGLYGDPAWVALPKSVTHRKCELPPPPKPIVIDDGFEDTPVGTQAANARTSEENDRATIRVTEEKAAKGKRSLKFIDMPGLKRAYNPHMYYTPNLKKGVVTAAFDLWLGPKAMLYHEWRDAHHPYRVGPSVSVTPGGKVLASKKPVMTIPTGKWVRFEITCGLGPQSTKTYDLVVTVPGQAPKRFEKLPNGHTGFRTLNWCGFVADRQQNCAFYLDNVSIK